MIAAGSDLIAVRCGKCVVGIDPRGCSNSVHVGGETRFGERAEPFRLGLLVPMIEAWCCASASVTGKRMSGARPHQAQQSGIDRQTESREFSVQTRKSRTNTKESRHAKWLFRFCCVSVQVATVDYVLYVHVHVSGCLDACYADDDRCRSSDGGDLPCVSARLSTVIDPSAAHPPAYCTSTCALRR